MIQNIENIFNNNQCINEDVLLKYVYGQLDKSTAHRVERHLVECELCSDAAEGIRLLHTPSDAENDLMKIHSKIQSGENKARIIPINRKLYYAIAASILILFSLGYFFNERMSEEKSKEVFTDNFEPLAPDTNSDVESSTTIVTSPFMNESSTPGKMYREEGNKNPPEFKKKVTSSSSNGDANGTDVDGLSMQDSPLPDKETKQLLEENKNADDDFEDVKPVAGAPKQEVPSKDYEKTDVNTNSVIPNTTETTDKKSLQKKKEKTRSNVGYSTAPSSTSSDNYKPSENESTLNINYAAEGMKKYAEKNYKEAIVLFNLHLNKQPNDYKICLYNGIAYLSINQPKDAIELFDKIIANNTITYIQDAQWYKALALISSGKKREARKLLKTIIAGNGTYKSKAEEALNNL